jgi:hypothetical protein
VADKTVYPIPGVTTTGVEPVKQTVHETWADELVSSGAFRYTELSAEAKQSAKQSLLEQEVKRVTDAQQSNSEINAAKLNAKLAAASHLPPEAISKTTPLPPEASSPRSIAGISDAHIQSAVDDVTPKTHVVAGKAFVPAVKVVVQSAAKAKPAKAAAKTAAKAEPAPTGGLSNANLADEGVSL